MLFQYLEQLLGLVLPTQTLSVGEEVAVRFLFGCHPWDFVWDAMTRNLTEVTLPLTPWTLLIVPQAYRMERPRTVITTDKLTPVIEADTTLV